MLERDRRATGNGTAVEATQGKRAIPAQRSLQEYSVAAISGTIGVGLVADSTLFSMKYSFATSNRAFIERVRIQCTTIAGFLVPITAGRSLILTRGWGGATNPSGGTSVPILPKMNSLSSPSGFDELNTGDVRVAATVGLTTVGVTFDTAAIRVMSLTHVGTAGSFFEEIIEFNPAAGSAPLVIEPGQLFAIRNTQAFELLAGTFTVGINVAWREVSEFVDDQF